MWGAGAQDCSAQPEHLLPLPPQNCQHNTEGPQCNKCKAGFFGDATKATATACRPCPCPYIDASRRSDPAQEGQAGQGAQTGEWAWGILWAGSGETWFQRFPWSINYRWPLDLSGPASFSVQRTPLSFQCFKSRGGGPRDFPGGPAVKILCFLCKGPEFKP